MGGGLLDLGVFRMRVAGALLQIALETHGQEVAPLGVAVPVKVILREPTLVVKDQCCTTRMGLDVEHKAHVLPRALDASPDHALGGIECIDAHVGAMIPVAETNAQDLAHAGRARGPWTPPGGHALGGAHGVGEPLRRRLNLDAVNDGERGLLWVLGAHSSKTSDARKPAGMGTARAEFPKRMGRGYETNQVPNPAAMSPTTFQALLAPFSGELRGYVYRLVGNQADSEELLQETLVKALERRDSLKDRAAFRAWVFRVASSTCLDFLRKQKRWGPTVQVDVQAACAENEAYRQEFIATVQDAEFAFDVHEHISFCLTCVGRALPPEQQAAVVLRELMGFTNQEAADVLGIGEGKLRHQLSDGRRAMKQAFEGLCTLVNKAGVCRQCASFRQTSPEGRRGPSLPVIGTAPDPWQARLEAAHNKGVEDGVSLALHELFHRHIGRLVGQTR